MKTIRETLIELGYQETDYIVEYNEITNALEVFTDCKIDIDTATSSILTVQEIDSLIKNIVETLQYPTRMPDKVKESIDDNDVVDTLYLGLIARLFGENGIVTKTESSYFQKYKNYKRQLENLIDRDDYLDIYDYAINIKYTKGIDTVGSFLKGYVYDVEIAGAVGKVYCALKQDRILLLFTLFEFLNAFIGIMNTRKDEIRDIIRTINNRDNEKIENKGE